MKRLVITYFGTIAVIILISVILSLSNGGGEIYTLNLPKNISVYIKEENITREMNFEEYVLCVVTAEVPGTFHEEAIKAQALAARTYIYNKYVKFTNDPSLAPDGHKDAVVCTDYAHCCAYYSREKLLELHGQQWMDDFYDKLKGCVEETKGEIIMYDGQPIVASFHASSGKNRTENSGEVWTSDLPYLSSVESKGEDSREGYKTTVKIPCDSFKTMAEEKYPEIKLSDDKNKWFGEITYTKGESVATIEIGGVALRGTEVRTLAGLKSACFDVDMLDDTVTFTVYGSGHGVGLSQHGANLMANGGSDYKEIVKWYYTGVEIKK